MKYALSIIFLIALGCVYVTYDTYTVERVIDGDTLVVSRYGKEVSVRLIGIDAPEDGGCYAGEGTAVLTDYVGDAITLKMDDTQNAYDQYGRILAYVYVDDLLVNEALIREGYAKEYTYIVPYTHQEAFQTAENEAQTFARGAWGACESWRTGQCGEGMLCAL